MHPLSAKPGNSRGSWTFSPDVAVLESAAHCAQLSTAIVLALAGISVDTYGAPRGQLLALNLLDAHGRRVAPVWAARRGVAARVAVVTPALAATMIPGL
jgi:hypothetical protein